MSLLQIQAALTDFEHKYGLSPDRFYQAFTDGKLDDNLDFTEWASLVQMANHLRRREATPPLSEPYPSDVPTF